MAIPILHGGKRFFSVGSRPARGNSSVQMAIAVFWDESSLGIG